MTPGNHVTDANPRAPGKKKRWYKPIRCSICKSYIWSGPILLKEPPEAPEPRHEWILCKPCHKALSAELSRSTISSPIRLRIAMGLVAAERSPYAYPPNTQKSEQAAFQQEFNWFVWILIAFTALHAIIFIILWVPR
jgi:hypothetical protein